MIPPQSDLQKAVENVNPNELEKNITKTEHVAHPESLDKAQTPPFIDESVRTDK